MCWRASCACFMGYCSSRRNDRGACMTRPYGVGLGVCPRCTPTCAGCAGVIASDLWAAASALLSASAMGCKAGGTPGCCTPLVSPGAGPAVQGAFALSPL